MYNMKVALWFLLFGVALSAFGEVLYTIAATFLLSIEEIAFHLYYVLWAASLVVVSICGFCLSRAYSNTLKELFRGAIFYSVAKLGNELAQRATEFDRKEIIYWAALAIYISFRIYRHYKK